MKIGFHKDVFKPSLLKSTAVFLVFVFVWTNMGLYQAVYAATTSSSQHRVASNEENINKGLSISPPDKGDARGLDPKSHTMSFPSRSKRDKLRRESSQPLHVS